MSIKSHSVFKPSSISCKNPVCIYKSTQVFPIYCKHEGNCAADNYCGKFEARFGPASRNTAVSLDSNHIKAEEACAVVCSDNTLVLKLSAAQLHSLFL